MRLLETVYHEYFELNKDISSHAFLADVGSRVLGIPVAEVLECLEREDWDQATEMLIDDVRNRGFRAIPQFILLEKYLAGGWQQPSFFLDVFEQIRRQGSHTRAGSG
jgi:predicted DsbA family dithiol-disulfide isomerase